ncbi:replication initiator protein [Flyfo microvirus Tbat1_59]|nr:replication initiator protein [Flyfo microvirus Tbat1_59]
MELVNKIVFMCLTPVFLKKETARQMRLDPYFMNEVPCGKCLECKKGRVDAWALRLQTQLLHSDSAQFITLTYDDNNLPYSNNGNMSLYYVDTQRFLKRLRKRNDSKTANKIKYYLVGEYGSQTYRPHYHCIIFNVVDPDDIRAAWTHGHVDIGRVEDASIYYTLKYVTKNLHKTIHDTDDLDDRLPERALMSKGLGLDFLTPAMVKYFKESPERPVTLKGGTKIGLPRYFRDKLFTDNEIERRNKHLSKHLEKRLERLQDPLFPQRVQKMLDKNAEKHSKTD